MPDKPQYIQIQERIDAKILSGIYMPGDALPTERDLCEVYSVSRVTIRKAINLLVKSRKVERIQGKGTFVCYPESSNNIYNLSTFSETQAKFQHHSEVLEFYKGAAPEEVYEILALEEGEPLFYCKRLRFVDESPVILEESWMIASLFPDLKISTMEGSKYGYIDGKGYVITSCDQRLEPIMPNKELQQQLNLSNGQPILKMTSTGNFDDDTVFEYSILHINTWGQTFNIKALRSLQ